MSTETVQDSRRIKKTARELIADFKELLGKGAKVYIPAICKAMKQEYPDWSNKKIKDTIIEELKDDLTINCIQHHWPDDVLSNKVVETRKEKLVENAIFDGMKIFEKATKQYEEMQERNAESEEIAEAQVDTEVPDILQVSEEDEPEENRTVMERFGDITKAQFELWKSLTRNDTMPHVHDDLIVDHIKPSRRFRKGIINKLEGTERAGLSRRCGYLVAILQDTLEMIEEIDKK